MRRRILFVIRTKLGDSLMAYQVARRYADDNPDDLVEILIRRDYAALLKSERGVRFVFFANRMDMLLRLLWLRVTRPAYDVLAVLRGYGEAMQQIAKVVRAKSKIYPDSRFPTEYPQFPENYESETLLDPSWRAVQVFCPEFKRPNRLEIPSLMQRRQAMVGSEVIGVVPLANELRRNLDVNGVSTLLDAVRRLHPGARLKLLINPHDRTADVLLAANWPEDVELVRFTSLQEAVYALTGVTGLYGTDTGLCHLAAAMGCPVSVFFGPTQPRLIVLPEQFNVTWYRLQSLGDRHCDITDCSDPCCLRQTIANFANATPIALERFPANCPLRDASVSAQSLLANTRHNAGDDGLTA